jgi:hypothetical protein
MRRELLFIALCALPISAAAQTPSYIVGNTLVPSTPAMMIANGGRSHGPGRGGSAPSPSPATSPSPAPSQSFGEPSRGESSFTYQQPIRVQVEGLSAQPMTELPPFTVQPQPSGCCATLTIPVQVLFRQPAAQPTPQSQVCPTGCAAPEPTPMMKQRVCNAAGQCIPWP